MINPWNKILKNSFDFHTHSSPSIFPRRQNDWELINDVISSEMGGIILKAHEGNSYDRANLIRQEHPDLNIYGGLVCNNFVGGLNKIAVELALNMNAKIIWMPTLSSSQHKMYFSKNKKENVLQSNLNFTSNDEIISVLENGEVKDEVKQILSLIAEFDVVLATGHLNKIETLKLVDEAKIQGVRKILIQHADLGVTPLSLDDQKYFVNEGCMIEKCYLACSDDFNDITISEMADSILELGTDYCLLVTDYGQEHNLPVVKALENFCLELLNSGLTETDIKEMVVNNPKKLLNIK